MATAASAILPEQFLQQLSIVGYKEFLKSFDRTILYIPFFLLFR